MCTNLKQTTNIFLSYNCVRCVFVVPSCVRVLEYVSSNDCVHPFYSYFSIYCRVLPNISTRVTQVLFDLKDVTLSGWAHIYYSAHIHPNSPFSLCKMLILLLQWSNLFTLKAPGFFWKNNEELFEHVLKEFGHRTKLASRTKKEEFIFVFLYIIPQPLRSSFTESYLRPFKTLGYKNSLWSKMARNWPDKQLYVLGYVSKNIYQKSLHAACVQVKIRHIYHDYSSNERIRKWK